MIVNYLVENADKDGFVERYEPLNLGFKLVDSEDKTEVYFEIYNTDLSGKEHKVHIQKQTPLSETEMEIFHDLLEDAINSGERLICLFSLIEEIREPHMKKQLATKYDYLDTKFDSSEDENVCPHCGETNEG